MLDAFVSGWKAACRPPDWLTAVECVLPPPPRILPPMEPVSEVSCPECRTPVLLGDGERLERATRRGPQPLRRPCEHLVVRPVREAA